MQSSPSTFSVFQAISRFAQLLMKIATNDVDFQLYTHRSKSNRTFESTILKKSNTMDPLEEFNVGNNIDQIKSDEEVEILDSKIEEHSDSLSCSSSGNQDEVSIQKQVGNIEALIAQHELDETKAKLDEAEKTLESQKSQLKEIDQSLKEKEEMVSKLKLERDLAEAERRMTKHQVSVLLDVKGNLDMDTNPAQFVPFDNCADDHVCLRTIERDLLNDLQKQHDLHEAILKHFEDKKDQHLPPKISRSNVARKLNCWFYFINSRRKMSKVHIGCAKMSFKKMWKKDNNAYHPIQDYYQEESASLGGITINRDSDKSIQVIDEIQSYEVKSRDNIQQIQRIVRSQNNRILLLQREVEKLMSMQLVCDDSTFSSTDGEDSTTTTSDCFFSICSESEAVLSNLKLD